MINGLGIYLRMSFTLPHINPLLTWNAHISHASPAMSGIQAVGTTSPKSHLFNSNV